MKPKFTPNHSDIKLLQHSSWHVHNTILHENPTKKSTRTNEHHLKFPLGNGGLLIMRGATQKNWLHHIPKTKNECLMRINLTFRTLYTQD